MLCREDGSYLYLPSGMNAIAVVVAVVDVVVAAVAIFVIVVLT